MHKHLLRISLFIISNLVAGDPIYCSEFMKNNIILNVFNLANHFAELTWRESAEEEVKNIFIESVYIITNFFLVQNPELNRQIFGLGYVDLLKLLHLGLIAGEKEHRLINGVLHSLFYMIHIANDVMDFDDFKRTFYTVGLEDLILGQLNNHIYVEPLDAFANSILDLVRTYGRSNDDIVVDQD